MLLNELLLMPYLMSCLTCFRIFTGLYDSEMVKCISCHEWFHLRCLSSREVKHIKDDVTFQYSRSKCLKS